MSSDELHPIEYRLDREEIVKELGKVRSCQSCGNAKLQSDLKKCGGCKQVFYCGKDCQTAHWSNHKQDCKRLLQMKQKNVEQLGRTVEKLRRKWLDRAFTQEEFNQQPPEKMFVLCMEFNFNYGTFMPVTPPVVFSLDQLSEKIGVDTQYNDEQAEGTKISSNARTHYMNILFQGDSRPFISTIDPDEAQQRSLELGFDLDVYSHDHCCKILSAITLPKNLYDPLTHGQIAEHNLSKQIAYFQEAAGKCAGRAFGRVCRPQSRVCAVLDENAFWSI